MKVRFLDREVRCLPAFDWSPLRYNQTGLLSETYLFGYKMWSGTP